MGRAKSGMSCPECDHPGDIRTSKKTSKGQKTYYYQCNQPGCMYQWTAMLTVVSGQHAKPLPAVNFGPKKTRNDGAASRNVSFDLEDGDIETLGMLSQAAQTDTQEMAKTIYMAGLNHMILNGQLRLG